MTLLRVLAAVHGYLAVLAAAALLHPAILLRAGKPPSRRARWAMLAATALSVATYGGGLLIYGSYRRLVKRALFSANLRAGLGFETKEHLAVLVVSLALGACFAVLVAPKSSVALRKTAALFFALAAATALVLVGLGTWVSSMRSF